MIGLGGIIWKYGLGRGLITRLTCSAATVICCELAELSDGQIRDVWVGPAGQKHCESELAGKNIVEIGSHLTEDFDRVRLHDAQPVHVKV